MENHYSIATNNKYHLFLDDDCDPFEILKSQEEEKLKSKTDKNKKDVKNEKAKTGKNKAAKKPSAPVVEPPKTVDQNANKKEEVIEQKPRGKLTTGKPTETSERTGSTRPFRESGNREVDRPPRRERQDKERTERPERPNTEFRDRTERPESGRGRGRTDRGGRGRGGRGGRGGFDSRGKREFERHSGSDKTGIKPVDKRDGGGAHNWGTIKDELEKEKPSGEPFNDSLNEENVESPDTENQNPNTTEPTEETPVEEEGPKEMTLDEWKATQKRTQASFNIRKPNEGSDSQQWKKTFVLKKQVEESEEEDDTDDDMDEDHRQKKNLLNIEITFNDQPQRGRGGRRGGGRGGRGGERGGRGGRGFGPRGDRGPRGGRDMAPHIEDENDFPSLGAK